MEVVRGRADVEDPGAFLERLRGPADGRDCLLQAFDARLVASDAHLRAAVAHARRSLARNEAVADDPAVEVLLYAAGRRQIERAVEMGVPAGEDVPVAVLVVERDGAGHPDVGATTREPPADGEAHRRRPPNGEPRPSGDRHRPPGDDGEPAGGDRDPAPPGERPWPATDAERAVAETVREAVRPADAKPDPERLADYFGVSAAERAATGAPLEWLVRERVALLHVEK